MTAQQLSEECRRLGAPIHRSTITKIENGRPRFDLGELLVLATVLVIPPAALVFPGPYNEEIEVLPGLKASQFDAAQWFSGLSNKTFGAQSEELNAARTLVRNAELSARETFEGARETFEEAIARLDALEKRIAAGEAEQARFIEEQRGAIGDA